MLVLVLLPGLSAETCGRGLRWQGSRGLPLSLLGRKEGHLKVATWSKYSQISDVISFSLKTSCSFIGHVYFWKLG